MGLVLLFIIFSWGNWGTERWSSLPELVTKYKKNFKLESLSEFSENVNNSNNEKFGGKSGLMLLALTAASPPLPPFCPIVGWPALQFPLLLAPGSCFSGLGSLTSWWLHFDTWLTAPGRDPGSSRYPILNPGTPPLINLVAFCCYHMFMQKWIQTS